MRVRKVAAAHYVCEFLGYFGIVFAHVVACGFVVVAACYYFAAWVVFGSFYVARYFIKGVFVYYDPGQYRSANEGAAWPLGDPIARLKMHLIGLGEWDEDRHAAQDKELAELVKSSAKEAEKNGVLGHGLHQPFDTMFEDIFEEMPWHLIEQRDQMRTERADKGI